MKYKTVKTGHCFAKFRSFHETEKNVQFRTFIEMLYLLFEFRSFSSIFEPFILVVGLEGCRKVGMQERRDAGKEGCRKGGIQESKDAGKQVWMKGGMQEKKD